MADPVANKSRELKAYLSNQPETLVAYAKWYGKVAETITGAEVAAIDSKVKSLTLTCTFKNGNRKQVRVVLDPPFAGYEDVKPRLLEMKTRALEGLGMVKSPVVNTFRFPTLVFKTTLGTVCGLLYLTFVPNTYVEGTTLKGIWAFTFAAHGLQALYTLNLARKHAGNFTTGAGYVLGTFIFGFPFWIDMRQRINSARINSVAKIQ
ncbi:hypothetical protein BDZ89DRAFT_1057812 [Hymenopellis radicata]|nr:hypothetical protein BDZ89DRAFT_1057812 [Hymenopellis radicata]